CWWCRKHGSGGERLELRDVAKVGQTFDQTFLLLIGGTAIEVIAAEVVVHRPILEHVVDRGKDGRDDGHNRLLGAAPGFDAVKLSVPPLRTRLDRRLPALSSLRGHMQAHEMRCAAEGNRLMSIPISETMTWAPRFLKPGIGMISSTAVRKGPRFASTWASSVAIAASRASIWLR